MTFVKNMIKVTLAGLMLMMGLASPTCFAGADDIRLALVSHAPDGDPWWEVVKKGMRDADRDFGVTTNYLNAPQGGSGAMKPLLEKLAGYDGVISTLADFAMTKSVLQDISGRRTPLITINNGTLEESQQVGAFIHIGMDDRQSGQQVGKMARSAGAQILLCISHLDSSSSALARCSGFADMLGHQGRWQLLKVGRDPGKARQEIAGTLRGDFRPDAILTLGALSAEPTIAALQESDLNNRKIFFATYDYSPAIINAIRRGVIRVAVDQQPYLQGYIPVAMLAIMLKQDTRARFDVRKQLNESAAFQRRLQEYQLTPSFLAQKIGTAASLITKENVDTVAPFAGTTR